MLALTDKVALVTGGSRGIGLELVRTFLAQGASVLYTGTSESSLVQARQSLDDHGRLHGIIADFVDPTAPQQVVTTAIDTFGGLDVLINNAGVLGPTDVWAMDSEEWDRVQAVNLRAAFFCARDAARTMHSRGGGSIINMASVAGQIGGVASGPAYAASKAGLIGLTRSLARRFAPLGVRVNCIAPADIETDMTAAWSDELRERLRAMTPLGRFGQTNEIAAVAIFLAGADSSYVTGQTLNVNGGLYMG